MSQYIIIGGDGREYGPKEKKSVNGSNRAD